MSDDSFPLGYAAPDVSQRKVAGTADKFIKRYKPIMEATPNGEQIKFYYDGNFPSWATTNHVWTGVHVSGKKAMLLLPGVRFVNALVYIVCRVPWNHSEEMNTGYNL
jgi:hypothetical protein